jgi:hypothetical protein
MRLKTLLIILICLAAATPWPARAATLFSDAFSDTNQSKINWIWQGVGCRMTFSNGAAILTNTDTVYSAFLVHNFTPTKPARFTLSATFTLSTPVNGAGFMYCLGTSGSNFVGYSLQLGTAQNVFVYKYAVGGGTLVIPNKSSSAIAAGTNTLAVSKSLDTFNIFVNGQYVTRFNDALYPSGDVAILVPPKSSFKIDNVLVTDQFQTDNTPTCFSDSFKVTDLEGWNTSPMMGNATVGARRCILDNTDQTYSSIIYTDGNFKTASIKAAVRQQKGAGMYGVCFVSVIPQDSGRVQYKPYAFLVDSMRRYSIVYPDSANVRTRAAQSFIYGSLGTDTLEVIRYANHFGFKVNGTDVGEIIPAPASYRIDGAGLYVSKQTGAAYNYFIVGGDSTGAVCSAQASVINRSILTTANLPRFGGVSVVYDLRGRRIGSLDKLTFNKLISGPYIIVTKSASGAALRAVRVMKMPR